MPKTKPITPADRLTRMRKSFEKNHTILLDDYEHFAVFTPRESTPPSRAGRKSAARSGRRSRGQTTSPPFGPLPGHPSPQFATHVATNTLGTELLRADTDE